MKISARNVLPGKVTNVTKGAVNSEVGIQLPGGTMLVASFTKESVQALDLKLNDGVSAVVKASHVRQESNLPPVKIVCQPWLSSLV